MGERRQERSRQKAEREEGPRSLPSPFPLPPSPFHLPTASTVAIIGGGLAGLAAAVAAAQRGLRVELFEQARWLGGRAGSFVDSDSGQRIDYCQHVALGCCTSFLDFCRRTGVDDCFDRSDKLHFIAPDGTRHDFAASRWLPAPLHLLPALLKLNYLSLGERWGIIRAMRRLLRERTDWESISPLPPGEGQGVRAAPAAPQATGDLPDASPHPNPLPAGEGTIGQWLRRQGQSERTIERFWSVVLVSALGETVERASLAAAQQVFRDGFLASRAASELVLPQRPLGEIFDDRVGNWLADHGVTIHRATPVRRVEGAQGRAEAVVLADGARRPFDAVIVAVPWHKVRSLLAEDLLAAIPTLADIQGIEPAAITAVHLWFDRPIAPLRHAVLVGRLGQWVFSDPHSIPHTPCAGPAHGVCRLHYCQVVISASHRLAPRKHDELLAEVRGELDSIWPAARAARLVHGRVVAQPAAVFSCVPGLDRLRPPQQTPIENLALAGDWTATGWPATMESAVRSGNRAADALFQGWGGS
jgi:squalene-associated FAD-dependent desaturase